MCLLVHIDFFGSFDNSTYERNITEFFTTRLIECITALLASFFKTAGQKQDKNLENAGQFTVHIKTYIATVPNEQSLWSEQL